MSHPHRVGALDVRDCSTCGHAIWDDEADHLACVEPAFSADVDLLLVDAIQPSELGPTSTWISNTKFDPEGFPTGKTTNCPGWTPAWEK